MVIIGRSVRICHSLSDISSEQPEPPLFGVNMGGLGPSEKKRSKRSFVGWTTRDGEALGVAVDDRRKCLDRYLTDERKRFCEVNALDDNLENL